MRNITISVDERVAKWARVWAAEHDSSVSRMVGEMLRKRMEEESGYQAAMKDWMSSRKPIRFREPGEPLPTREELHERRRPR
ncbi:MAG: CopG family transcriptional regulator [Myxococcales bacterium]|nr:CopG family transcriptional regulator [Myxococcales bacterium]